MDMTHGDLEQHCREVVERLYATYNWRLLDQEQLISRTLAVVEANGGAELHYVAFGIYNSLLYEACLGQLDEERWNRAYEELYIMLSMQAKFAYPDLWEDAVQNALEAVSRQLEQCHEPRAFFQFAWGYVRNAVRSLRPHLRRKDRRPDVSLEREVDGTKQPPPDDLADLADSIEAELISAEIRQELRTGLAAIERKHPRAHRQFAAVKLKFIDGLDDEEISRRLGVSVQGVYELRSHGLKKLRADPSLNATWRDLGE